MTRARPAPGPERARILMVRTSSLGDIVHSLPVLTALRRQLPAAALGWVVEEVFAPVLAGHPDLDQLIVVRLRHWRRRPLAARTLREVAAFLAAVRRFSPQVTLDLMGNHKAGVTGLLSLARRRIGHARPGRPEPSSTLWLTETVPARGIHAVDRALSLLDALGLPPEPADFGGDKLFRSPPGAASDSSPGAPPLPIAGLRTVPRAIDRTRPNPFVLLHPGAGWGNKAYPPAWWAETLRLLHAATGWRARVAAAPGEESLAAAVAAGAGPAAELTSAPDLPALAALLRQAALVLGGDSGPIHLAHAMGTPVLMVMGPTDPARHGPYGAPERAIHRRLPCSFCYRRFAEAKACLLEIPPERLAERAAALLLGSPSGG
jgi:heptosyltransferase-1